MLRSSLAQIAEITRGRFLSSIREGFVSRVCTDSRELLPGDLFVAIAGEHHDAHDFVGDVLQRGAVGALVQKDGPWEKASRPVIMVADTVASLAALAAYNRSKVRAKVVAVTGSNGKTTTKEMIAHLLATAGSVVKSPKSFNNHIGVPLTLLMLDNSHDYAVVELGANAPGEIRALAKIVVPDVAVVTSVGMSHLQGFKDLAGVAQAKGELLETLGDKGLAVINGDNEWTRAMAQRTRARVFRVGGGADVDMRFADVGLLPGGISFVVNQSVLFHVPALGAHNAMNATLALAVCRRFGLEMEELQKAFIKFKNAPMRMNRQVVGGWTLINDAYNANPDSTVAAVNYLGGIATNDPRVFVLGRMAELGDFTVQGHEWVGEAVARAGVDYFAAIGDEAAHAARKAVACGMDSTRVHAFADKAGAETFLLGLGLPKAVVLFKASRVAGLETLVEVIKGRLPGV